ncbi:SMI1/KNR4 family protein [bacterium]|nr:SMI1/KNR4 family protein [bacterium]
MNHGICWVIRMNFIIEMRHVGVSSLVVAMADTMQLLMDAFLAQNQWLVRLAAPEDKISKLVQELGYRLPVELLTLYLCFYGTISDLPTEELLGVGVKNQRDLRWQYRATHGVMPHVANLVKEARASIRRGSAGREVA